MNTHRNLTRRVAAATTALVLTLPGCGGDDGDQPASGATTAAPSAAASENTVTIASFSFSGPSQVPAGTVLTVVNDDTVPHTLTADDDAFDTGTIQPGDSAQITLDTAGTFGYHCNIHGSMTGSITVT